MHEKRPQNPVYPVDPGALQACLPKVVCAACGTVMGVRQGGAGQILVRCPACHESLSLKQADGVWQSELIRE